MPVRTLRSRFAIAYMLLSLSSLLVLGAYLLHSSERYVVEQLGKQLESQAGLVLRVLEHGGEGATVVPGGLERTIAQLAATTGARITLVDTQGRVLVDTHEDPALMENHADRPEIRQALAEGSGQSLRYSNTLGTRMIYVAVAGELLPGVPGLVRIALPAVDVRQRVVAYWGLVGAAVAIGLATGILASLYVAQQVSRPVEEIARVAERLASGHLSDRVPLHGTEEIGRLGQALNNMAQALQDRMEEISMAKARLETVLENVVSAVLFIDTRRRIVFANGTAQALLAPKVGLVGQYYPDVIRHDLLAEAIEVALHERTRQRLQVEFFQPSERVAEVSLVPLVHREALQGLVVVLYDITELKRLERMRRDFVANISHELRTPVTAVKGFAESLLEGALEDPETVREFAGIIAQEADRLARLVDDLLELSLLESGVPVLQLTEVELTSLAEEMLERVRPQLERAGLSAGVRYQGPVVVRGDRHRLGQVLANLLDNAIKYTPSGGRIEVGVVGTDVEATLWVADTGVGIPRNEISRIFERFYRVKHGERPDTGGSGLGLAIARHIVRAHGGSIEVESEPGQGSRFIVRLPLNREGRS